MEDKGFLILGEKRTKFNVWTDENIKKGKILFNPEDFKSFIEPVKPSELKINLNKLAREVALKEGGKEEVSIAQIKQIMKILFTFLGKYPEPEIIRVIDKYKE